MRWLAERREIERPVERAVAAADDQNALVAERLHLAHRIVHRFALIGLDAGNRRTLGLERAAAGGNHDDLALELLALIGLHAKQRVADLLDRLDHLAEMKLRIERLDLLHQALDQAVRAGDGDAGNVVDRLLRIKLGALAADLVENIDEVAFHVEQSELEHREQADGSGADNDYVGLDRFAHVVSVLVLI